jgi:hypothetical protein
MIMPVCLTDVYVFSYGKYVNLLSCFLIFIRLDFLRPDTGRRSIIFSVSIPVFQFVVSSPAFRPTELKYKTVYGLFYDTDNI